MAERQTTKKVKEGTKTAKPRGTVARAKVATTKKLATVSKRRAEKLAKGPATIATAQPKPLEVPEGLPRKYLLKSTFNTQDIMHSPVEKTLKMIDKILSGEKLFTM